MTRHALQPSRVRDAAICITHWCAWPSRARRRASAPGNVANVAKSPEIAEQTEETATADMDAVRRFEEHADH